MNAIKQIKKSAEDVRIQMQEMREEQRKLRAEIAEARKEGYGKGYEAGYTAGFAECAAIMGKKEAKRGNG